MPKNWRRGRYVGKYRLKRRIGSGGFADVYRAYDTVQRMEVALKLPTTDDADDLDDLAYEVKIASRLAHPNLLPVLNADYIEGTLVVAHPLGVGSLDDRLDQRPPVQPVTAISMVEQLLLGLRHAHTAGILHNDVKPANVICFPKGQIKLGDFGLCKRTDGNTRKTSEPGGTLGYMAPELAMGYPSPRSDLFSAALIAYELFARRSPVWPFDWPPPRLERVPPELHDWFRQALQPNARHRHANASDMLEVFLAASGHVLERVACSHED